MRFDALRQSAAAVRLARALWIAWAIVVWNVVFDHVIVVAGRDYLTAADRAAFSTAQPRRFEDMDVWMRPAVTRGAGLASVASGAILIAGLSMVRAARAPHTNR